jgi:phage baseplate assembly protein W
MAYRHYTGNLKRPTVISTKQPSHLCADWYAVVDRRNPTSGQCYLKEKTMLNIDFPFHFDNRGRTASVGDEDHIKDMIEQFLFTNSGERVNRPDFGSGILQLIFAPNSPELAATLQFTIQAGLQQWLGDIIEVQELSVSSEDASLRVELTYKIRRTNQITVATFIRSTQS